MENNKAIESRIRRKLKKRGYTLSKSRRQIDADNFGGYMVIDVETNTIVWGSRYDLSLEAIEAWIEEEERQER